MLAKIIALHKVCDLLGRTDVPFAIGGSGLLAFLGLEANVRDWDITTDVPFSDVSPILESFPHEVVKPNGTFATNYMAKFKVEEIPFDLMGKFVIVTEKGICNFPTRVCGHWNRIPIGSPEVWFVAYHLLNRKVKAERLYNYLHQAGYVGCLVEEMLEQPLPDTVWRELKSLKKTGTKLHSRDLLSNQNSLMIPPLMA